MKKVKVRNVVAFALLSSIIFGVRVACAEDLVVSAGDTVTISGEKTYGTISCNGNLTIADDSVITCQKFVLGTQSGELGEAEIGNRVSLSVGGTGTGDFVVGKDGGAAKFIIGTNSVVQYGKYFNIRRFSSDFVAKLDTEPSLLGDFNQVSIHLKKGASACKTRC